LKRAGRFMSVEALWLYTICIHMLVLYKSLDAQCTQWVTLHSVRYLERFWSTPFSSIWQ
jgi:hypothetical protein